MQMLQKLKILNVIGLVTKTDFNTEVPDTVLVTKLNFDTKVTEFLNKILDVTNSIKKQMTIVTVKMII